MTILTASLVAVGCQFVVSNSVEGVACTDEGVIGAPACPRGQVCVSGACQRCTLEDACGDGVDNNCDGEIDEGCDDAQGGEGGTSGEAGSSDSAGTSGEGGVSGEGGGGGTSGEGGVSGAEPGGASGESGEGGTSGEGGEAGAGTAGDGGTAGEGTAGEGGEGGAGTAGDGGTGGSEPKPPAHLGESCTDTTCDAFTQCVTLSELGVQQSGAVCTQPCCSSATCGFGTNEFVCIPTKLGGGMCLTAKNFGRATFMPADGSDIGEVGKVCSTGADCRSGWCDAGTCNDVCCSDATCGESVCTKRATQAGLVGSLTTLSCGTPAGHLPYGTSGKCSNDASCKSGLCSLNYAFESYCAQPCCSNSDCGSSGLPLSDVACGYVEKDKNRIRACVLGNSLLEGRSAGGSGCSNGSDCKSNLCVNGHCSDVCCQQSNCPNSQECRLVTVSGKSELRCVTP